MKYIAAYLLLQLGGKASPTAADITKLLGTVNIEVDKERLDKLISELKGKSIDELIAEGSSKLSSVRLLPPISYGIAKFLLKFIRSRKLVY